MRHAATIAFAVAVTGLVVMATLLATQSGGLSITTASQEELPMQVRFNVREDADSPVFTLTYSKEGSETLSQLIARAKQEIADAGLEIVSVAAV